MEELKDEDGQSSGYSEEEGVLSHGETSDKDGEELSRSPQLQAEFVPPDDELKERIMSQVNS